MTQIPKAQRGFIRFATVQTAILSVLAFAEPSLWSTQAYAWLLGIFPLVLIGALWLVLAITGGYIVYRTRDKSEDNTVHLALITAFNCVYTLVQFGFAWSIFILTFSGSHGAIAGSLQWGGLALIAWLWMKPDNSPSNRFVRSHSIFRT